MPKKIAEFKFDDKFNITGRGTVMAGQIISGEISAGNSIYLEDDKTIKISSIEFGRHSEKKEFVGLLIKPENIPLEYKLEKLLGKLLIIID